MLKEFKEFAIKGNAVDLAVGVIIGAAFGKIVSSIVEDLLMLAVCFVNLLLRAAGPKMANGRVEDLFFGLRVCLELILDLPEFRSTMTSRSKRTFPLAITMR